MKRNPNASPPTAPDGQPLTLVIDAGRNPESRRIAFTLLGDAAKREIKRLASGQWETSIPIPSDGDGRDEMKLFGRTRRDLESSVDRIVALLIDPQSATQLYRYFATLAARGDRSGCAISGDMITPTGEIINADSKTEAQ